MRLHRDYGSKLIPRNELTEFLVKEFGLEAIGNYEQFPLPTIILYKKPLTRKAVEGLAKIGWYVQGVHANEADQLQISFVD